MENVTTELLARLLDIDKYGFRVVSLTEERGGDGDDGEVLVAIETTATPVGCPACGVRAKSKGRRKVSVRDLEIAGRPAVLVWKKRLWACPDPACPERTWTEQSPFIGARKSLTERARYDGARHIGEENDSVAAQARRFGVGWDTMWRAFEDVVTPMVDDPARLEGVCALGIDETNFLKATPESSTQYVTSFVDLDAGKVLDLVEGRNANSVADWLEGRGPLWRGQVEVCAIDPHRGYLNGVARKLPKTVLVLDVFHVVRLGNRRVDAARRRVQNETLGHRGRKNDPLFRARKLLLMGAERHTEASLARMEAAFVAGDPYEEVACVWVAKELLRNVYKATDRRDANGRLFRFYDWCADHADIPELVSLAEVIEEWQDELLNFFDWRYSNGRTEAFNLMIKQVKRVGHGFRNFDNYRLRVLAFTGVDWDTPQTARLRASGPRKVA